MTDGYDRNLRDAEPIAPVSDDPHRVEISTDDPLTDAAQPAAPVGPAEPVNDAPTTGRWRKLALMFIVPLLAIGAGAWFWLSGAGKVETDNAYVQQEKVSIAADVGGRIVEVLVRENQTVKAGDLLFRIDPEPYRIALASADAAIATAQVNLVTLQQGYRTNLPDIAIARVAVAQAQETFDRQSALMDQGFTTRAQYETAQHALAAAKAQVAAAQATAEEARAKLTTGAAVPGQNPQIAAARAQRDKAALDLSRTDVRAPIGGIISQSDRLQVGQMMVSGLPAVSIVAGQGAYVEANFKETDLDQMRVGQRAEVKLDAYPGVKLTGRVASIGAGTGSEFSVLPAQNATGNWVKVTQRVPVRIAIDGASPRTLIAGLSADVTVFTDE